MQHQLHVRAPVPAVQLRREEYLHLLVHVVRAIARAEEHARAALAVLCGHDAQMCSARADPALFEHADIGQKHRLGIVLARRLQRREHAHGRFGKIRNGGRYVVFGLGQPDLCGNVVRQIAVQPLTQRVKIARLECQTRRLRMAAVFHEQIVRAAECLKDIHALDAAAGTGQQALVLGKHDHGIVIFFLQMRGRQPDHAGIPALAAHHDDAMRGKIEVLQLRLGRLVDLLFDLAAARVLCLEQIRICGDLKVILGYEQLVGHACRADAPARIDPGPQTEGDVP